MPQKTEAPDWSKDRGDSWRDHLTPLEAMLAPVTAPLIKALDLRTPLRIADIGCGGGETSLEIAKASAAGSTVDGFDISPALVKAASAKEAYGDVRPQFHIADAQQPPATKASFDRLTSRFGIMFFPDHEIAFQNLATWLAPEGQFAFAVWGPPEDNPWMTSIRKTVSDHIVLPTPAPDGPGPFRYRDADQFMILLRQSGFSQVESKSWRDQLAIGGGMDPSAAAEFALSAFSAGQLLNSSDQLTAKAARRDLEALFSDSVSDGQVRMDAHVHIVTGQKA
ncbi:MAG: class I SAM-dependent methyltransferase [Henriciella sp.]